MAVPGVLTPDKPNLIAFVIDDESGNEISGLGTSWTIEISIAGAPFVPATGTKGETGFGWYTYLTTAAEVDSSVTGSRVFRITHASARQQNLEYTVEPRVVGAVEVQYTVQDSVSSVGIAGVKVWVTADPGNSQNPFFLGYTDFAGVLRDAQSNLPRLDTGTMYVWKHIAGYTDDQNPHTIDTAASTVFVGTMTAIPADFDDTAPTAVAQPSYAYATPDDFQKYWFWDFGEGEEYEQLWPLLRMASSRVTSALAASDQIDCTRSDWGADYLKELTIIIAGVMFNSPAVRLSNDQRDIYSQYVITALDGLTNGVVQVCEGATGKGYPAYETARYGLTDRNYARIVASDRYE